MTGISQSIWKHVKQEGMALSDMAKYHSSKVNHRMIRHLTLSALVLASIQTSAVFVYANETEASTNAAGASADQTSASSGTKTASTAAASENTTAEDDLHFVSIKGGKTTDKNYANDGATGTDSMVIGIDSTATGGNATVLGNHNTVSGDKGYGNNGIIAGQGLNVQGINNAVFGTDYHNGDDFRGTRVYGDQNTVIGLGNTVGYTVTENDDGTLSYTPKSWKGDDQNVAVGMNNVVNGGSVVVGSGSTSGHLSVIFGDDNTVKGNDDYNVALGSHLKASGIYALSAGSFSSASGAGSIAIGSGWYAEDKDGNYIKDADGNRVLDGADATGKYAIAMGYKAKAAGDYAMAFGRESSATVQAIALGVKAKANENHSVALGAFSVADIKGGVKGYDPDEDVHLKEDPIDYTSSTWTSKLGAISVGDRTNGYTRQITNVAAGTLDTDAVNVAQLKRAIKDSYDDRQNIRSSIEKDEKQWGTDTKIKDVSLSYNKDTKKLNFTLTQTGDADPISKDVTLDGVLSGDSGLTKDTRNTVVAGDDHVDIEGTGENKFGGIEYKISVKADGKVEENNTGLISGSTVYNETRVSADGNYVKKSNTAGENLTALDMQVKRNADGITSLGDSVYDLNNRVGEMDDRINKVGAGAAALAALHPLDYDPKDK